MKDSQTYQNFQIQGLYSISQLSPQQNEGPTDVKMSIDDLVQSPNDYLQSINRLDAK